ncbi:hypothetical protein D3C78_1815180 [compost metagenome]
MLLIWDTVLMLRFKCQAFSEEMALRSLYLEKWEILLKIEMEEIYRELKRSNCLSFCYLKQSEFVTALFA